MKSSKSDGARNSQMNGSTAPAEAEPLFPRLHVSDTEKAGPRAPPRNKMALFEQFTVPTHRFAQPQPSRTSTAHASQPQQFDHRHSYFAYRTSSSVPYSAHPQPSHGVSSCVTSTFSESQRDSSSQSSEKCIFPRATSAKDDGSVILSSLLEKKAKVVSDDTLMQSSSRSRIKTQGALYTKSVFENICDKFVSAESNEMPTTSTTKNDLLEAMGIEEVGVSCPAVESQGCCHDGAEPNKRMEVHDALLTKRVPLKAAANAGNEHSRGCSSFASEQLCQRPDVDHEKVLPDGSSHSNDNAEAAFNTDLKNNGHTQYPSSPSGHCLAASGEISTSYQLLGSLHIREATRKSCPSDSKQPDARSSADVLLNSKGENIGVSLNNQIGSNAVSEISQQGTGPDMDDSPLSVLVVEDIRPKDVIRAVGQQQFWKARKALLRQQRIFSDQVFQLHKLIKVQQLLAETPSTLIDEEMPFGTVDHCAESPSRCTSVRKVNPRDEKARVTNSSKEQKSKDQGNKIGHRPESIQNPHWHSAAGKDGMGSVPHLPAFNPGGVSAWGYPSLGMGQWMGPPPAQGRPSAYLPFTGSFSSGVPFSGFYGAGSASPMFWVPHPGQRSEPWEEMSSTHGPPVAAGPNLRAAPAVGHVAPHDPSGGAWQFVQYNHPYYNQKFYAGVPERNASTHSAASINHQKPGRALHASGTEGEAGLPGRSNNNGLEDSMHQSEDFSPSDTFGFKAKSSTYSRSTPPPPGKAGFVHQETEQPALMGANSVFRTFSSLKQHEVNGRGGREEAHKGEVRLPKRQQGEQVPFNKGTADETTGGPSDQPGNALDLFPLVPSLSGQQAGAMWQGRVIKAVPHSAVAASQSAAGILLSLQRERRQ